MRDVFELRDSLIDKYSVFSRSFTRIAAADIQEEVNRQYSGGRYPFDPERRSELDAYYASLYGLSREDICYTLDPESVMGAGYPSETFRVLNNNEEKKFGEYRTQRLLLEAWDRQEGAW